MRLSRLSNKQLKRLLASGEVRFGFNYDSRRTKAEFKKALINLVDGEESIFSLITKEGDLTGMNEQMLREGHRLLRSAIDKIVKGSGIVSIN